jgi:hypothetical protein
MPRIQVLTYFFAILGKHPAGLRKVGIPMCLLVQEVIYLKSAGMYGYETSQTSANYFTKLAQVCVLGNSRTFSLFVVLSFFTRLL